MSNNNELTIKCPDCGAIIPLSDSAYNNIVSQVCNEEVDRRVATMKNEMQARLKEKVSDIEARIEQKYLAELQEKRTHFVQLKAQKEKEVSELQNALAGAETEKSLAVAGAVSERNKRISELEAENLSLNERIIHREALSKKEAEALKSKLEVNAKDKLIELAKSKDEEISNLKARIDVLEAEGNLKDEQIMSLKEFKSKMSTKMVGESLEQYCEHQYDRLIRPAIPGADFGKDTAYKTEKGDYIYRESNAYGVEVLSILFEMKNEDEGSPSKKMKNAAFFEKLDKDRNRRGCQIAVLVSTLEPDNDVYNSGITAVTENGYKRMFVIRPQNFIDFIHLMRSVASDRARLEDELAIERSKNADVTDFENLLTDYKGQISRNNALARSHSETVIKQIDNFIVALEKHKKEILAWQNQSELAEKKAEDLTIKRLTKNNATVAAMFNEKKECETEKDSAA